MPFVPLLEPPPDWETEPARWYWVRGSEVVLVDEPPTESVVHHFLGTFDGIACWAADVDGIDGNPGFQPLMALAAQLDESDWSVAGRAVQLAEWDRTHRFCGRCATPTDGVAGERARRCPACGLMAFPRLAPAAIVLVERDDGTALLARNRTFPIPMYSTIAGFVEPGETLEATVAREVHEEVGLVVGDIQYQSSQPWPFPHSLMLGFTAHWIDGEIACDGTEIIDANWYAPDDLPMIPPPLSIARRLIDGWLQRSTA